MRPSLAILPSKTANSPWIYSLLGVLLFVAIVHGLGGCAWAFGDLGAPYDGLALVAISSDQVEVLPPRLLQIHRQIFLDGSVRRAYEASTTANSRLRVSYFDAKGNVLANQLIAFLPSELPRRSSHRYNEGHYQFPITGLPQGTIRVEVKAVRTGEYGYISREHITSNLFAEAIRRPLHAGQ